MFRAVATPHVCHEFLDLVTDFACDVRAHIQIPENRHHSACDLFARVFLKTRKTNIYLIVGEFISTITSVAKKAFTVVVVSHFVLD
jgi:hypothetical protein